MDKLGGILTKGLLGNLILARFNLFLEIIVEIVPPETTPLPRGGGGGHYPDVHQKTIKITIIHRGREYVTIRQIDDEVLRVSINILKHIIRIKDSALSVIVKLRNKMINIKVWLNGN